MTIEINVLDIGADEVEVTKVLVSVGDKVEVEQSLITVEGDKVYMEVPSPQAGVVKEIKVAVGDKIETGKLIMIFEEIESGNASKEVNIPDISEDEVQVTEVLFKVGDRVESEQSLITVENDTTSMKVPAATDAYVHVTPVIRRLAREFGVNLTKIKGTGRKGRILREDIQVYVKEAVKRADAAPTAATGGSSLPGLPPWPKTDFSKFGKTEEVELGRVQKISGANLHRNWVMVPHVTQFDEADITEVETFRKQQNAEAEKKRLDVKITPLVFIMKAVAKALEELPRFNSSLSENNQKLTLKKYINIGVAVDTSNSLVVPVFRDINKKGIIELSRELAEISNKARNGKLTSSDMQGGCFTISSLGGIGGTAFTPIVNAPEVAILGVSKSSMKPVWNGKEFAPRLMLPLSLSYDHRVIDGADGARFISFINNVMSDIRRLMM